MCVFLSVAQLLDDQPELSYTVTERDLIVSEMETLRQPPPNPLTNKAGGDVPEKSGRETPRKDPTQSESPQNRIQRRTAEQIVDMPVLKVVEERVQVAKVSARDRGSTALRGAECRLGAHPGDTVGAVELRKKFEERDTDRDACQAALNELSTVCLNVGNVALKRLCLPVSLCHTKFRQLSTGCVVTNATLPRRHCLTAQNKTKQTLCP